MAKQTAVSTSGNAQWYANKGWKVFPCHSMKGEKCSCGKSDCASPGKHPLTVHGVKDATTDIEQIKAWWEEWPTANVAIATGRESGLVVVDIDPKNDGESTFEELIEANGELPDTPMVLTGGGGRHYYFAHPHKDKDCRNNPLGPGVDIRADGGYVIAPKSNHKSGRKYEWEAESIPTKTELAPLPDWITKRIAKHRKSEEPSSEGGYEHSPGMNPKEVLKGVAAGERDSTLYRYACRLRNVPGLSMEEAAGLVQTAAAACRPPFPPEEAAAKVERVWEQFPGPKENKIAKLLQLDDPEGPLITEIGKTGLKVEWVSKQLLAEISNLKEHSNGKIDGRLTISSMIGGGPTILRQASFTFTAIRTRNEWVKALNDRLPMDDWDSRLEKLCRLVTKHIERGEDAVRISIAGEKTEPPKHMVYPIILEDLPTIIFGHHGSAKSLTALMLGYLALAGPDAGRLLDFEVHRQAKGVLYLDWEMERKYMSYRLEQIDKALQLGVLDNYYYRRCLRPIAMDAERIRASVIECGADLLIVDSIGPAAGGELNSPESAVQFFGAIREIGITALILGHTSKANAGTSRATVFGSGFFENLARSIWEIRADASESDGCVDVAMIHKKNNFGPKAPAIGFRAIFDKVAGTKIQPIQAMDVLGAESAMTISTRIYELLSQDGVMSAPQIAMALDEPQNRVRAALSRMRDRGHAAKQGGRGGKWVATTQLKPPPGEKFEPTLNKKDTRGAFIERGLPDHDKEEEVPF